MERIIKPLLPLFTLALSAITNALAAPVLTPGVWTKITPAAVTITDSNHVFCQGMAIDPGNPSTLYLGICAYDVALAGLYKTTDGGSTWAKTGNLDEPVHMVVDPRNSNHLYCVDGVRGNTIGFWISNDGGVTWTKPPGFTAATQNPVGTQDLYSIATEPGDFNHILVSFHSPWNDGSRNAGVLESKDGGATWIVHNPPAGSASGYGMSVFFLYFPEHGLGNRNTWLFTAQAGGFFRTIDAGATWTQVYDKQMTHGGNQIYCSKTGVLYSGGYQYPARSTDNGASWQQVTAGLDYSWYIGICGDGNYLYTGTSGVDRPFFTSPENNGLMWSEYQGGVQKFSTDPFEMFFDSTNRIMYSANWEGLYALKVIEAGVAQPRVLPASTHRNNVLQKRVLAASGKRIGLAIGIEERTIGIYDVKGTLLGRATTGPDGAVTINCAGIGSQVLVIRVK
jgi:photosystem II stability/assembly factor-like uncharacterized protein